MSGPEGISQPGQTGTPATGTSRETTILVSPATGTSREVDPRVATTPSEEQLAAEFGRTTEAAQEEARNEERELRNAEAQLQGTVLTAQLQEERLRQEYGRRTGADQEFNTTAGQVALDASAEAAREEARREQLLGAVRRGREQELAAEREYGRKNPWSGLANETARLARRAVRGEADRNDAAQFATTAIREGARTARETAARGVENLGEATLRGARWTAQEGAPRLGAYLRERSANVVREAREANLPERSLNLIRKTGEWYKKQPFWKKLAISGALIATSAGAAALGGASGAAIAGLAFTGSTLRRGLAAASMFVLFEASSREAHGTAPKEHLIWNRHNASGAAGALTAFFGPQMLSDYFDLAFGRTNILKDLHVGIGENGDKFSGETPHLKVEVQADGIVGEPAGKAPAAEAAPAAAAKTPSMEAGGEVGGKAPSTEVIAERGQEAFRDIITKGDSIWASTRQIMLDNPEKFGYDPETSGDVRKWAETQTANLLNKNPGLLERALVHPGDTVVIEPNGDGWNIRVEESSGLSRGVLPTEVASAETGDTGGGTAPVGPEAFSGDSAAGTGENFIGGEAGPGSEAAVGGPNVSIDDWVNEKFKERAFFWTRPGTSSAAWKLLHDVDTASILSATPYTDGPSGLPASNEMVRVAQENLNELMKQTGASPARGETLEAYARRALGAR